MEAVSGGSGVSGGGGGSGVREEGSEASREWREGGQKDLFSFAQLGCQSTPVRGYRREESREERRGVRV